jgi:hypothetical protein
MWNLLSKIFQTNKRFSDVIVCQPVIQYLIFWLRIFIEKIKYSVPDDIDKFFNGIFKCLYRIRRQPSAMLASRAASYQTVKILKSLGKSVCAHGLLCVIFWLKYTCPKVHCMDSLNKFHYLQLEC